jgi:hypothetical protein
MKNNLLSYQGIASDNSQEKYSLELSNSQSGYFNDGLEKKDLKCGLIAYTPFNSKHYNVPTIYPDNSLNNLMQNINVPNMLNMQHNSFISNNNKKPHIEINLSGFNQNPIFDSPQSNNQQNIPYITIPHINIQPLCFTVKNVLDRQFLDNKTSMESISFQNHENFSLSLPTSSFDKIMEHIELTMNNNPGVNFSDKKIDNRELNQVHFNVSSLQKLSVSIQNNFSLNSYSDHFSDENINKTLNFLMQPIHSKEIREVAAFLNNLIKKTMTIRASEYAYFAVKNVFSNERLTTYSKRFSLYQDVHDFITDDLNLRLINNPQIYCKNSKHDKEKTKKFNDTCISTSEMNSIIKLILPMSSQIKGI